MGKIKLLYITQCYGGVGTYIQQIISNIDYEKFELEIVGPHNESFARYCYQYKVIFHELYIARGISIKSDFKAYYAIKRIIKKSNPDIIHLHSSKAGILGRYATRNINKEVIFTPHAISYMSFTGIKRAIFFLCEVFIRKHTKKVLTCSYSEATRLQYEIGIPAHKIHTICNSITIPKSIPFKRTFNETSDIHLGSIMRLTTQKNPLLYIDIANLLAKKYSKIQFSILGAGMTDDLKSEVLFKIEEYNLSDKFKIFDWGENSKSISYLDSLDIFLLPSLFEGLPLSPLEAMSKGVPCVLSKEDGCKDIIDNYVNGFSCITPNQYFDAVCRLIENPDITNKIRINALEYISKYHNMNKFILDLEHYYINCLK